MGGGQGEENIEGRLGNRNQLQKKGHPAHHVLHPEWPDCINQVLAGSIQPVGTVFQGNIDVSFKLLCF